MNEDKIIHTGPEDQENHVDISEYLLTLIVLMVIQLYIVNLIKNKFGSRLNIISDTLISLLLGMTLGGFVVSSTAEKGTFIKLKDSLSMHGNMMADLAHMFSLLLIAPTIYDSVLNMMLSGNMLSQLGRLIIT